ncbi:stage II sporulation protein R [Virgibacillus sp. W0181]|uniref:stage II sporulation protein R n=1 Tax=Virgibacillus sp. W0181 TaxID=3391581 RepID=UPI003F480F3A
MKKTIVSVIIFIISLTIPIHGPSENVVHSDQEYQIIPDEAIRLRILANSDDKKDQHIKQLIRDEVNAEITTWVEELTDIDEARRLIESRLPQIKAIVQDVLKDENKTQTAHVEYGKNVSFPMKLYGSYVYPPGEYEAVLITLGEGKGSNWWCVLFPPLCFLDFSNGTSVAEDEMEEGSVADEGIDVKADAENSAEQSAEQNEQVEDNEKEADEVEVNFFLFEWFGWT